MEKSIFFYKSIYLCESLKTTDYRRSGMNTLIDNTGVEYVESV